MIPRGRVVTTAQQLAQRLGVDPGTWRQVYRPRLRERVPRLIEGHDLYDLDQAAAYYDDRPLPTLPEGEHPDDLLVDKEVAAVLGVGVSTVHSYRQRGTLAPGTHPLIEVDGEQQFLTTVRVTRRADVEDRLRNAPGRGVGGGRPRGYDPERLRIAATALKAAGDAPPAHVAAALAAEHGGSPRTWQRILAAVRG
ncbi:MULTISPECIES: hypothetical protein [Streptomyces]|uniref:hypothetical protein n=1 Tax=Streptomyces TaxID=1883 RepID=UPI0004C86049|nr:MULTISPECIES: hypothetical protein [Streptomyces]